MDREISAGFLEPDARTCPHATECPGCPLLGLSYANQRAHKQQLVQAALTPYAELASLSVEPCVPGQPMYGYRTRAKWVAQGRSLGLFARASHRVLDLPGCLVVDPLIAAATRRLRQLAPPRALLDGADIARVGEQLLVTLIGGALAAESDLQALAGQLVQVLPEGSGIAITRRTGTAVQLLAGGHQHLHGAPELRASAGPGGPYHYVAFGAFMQANEHVAQAIRAELSRTCAALQRGRGVGGDALRVLELYAGSGALALSLAVHGMRVTAVESYAPACERLERAAREQRIPIDVQQGDAEACVLAHASQGTRFDVVLLNPPRRGLPPALRNAVAALQPAHVGYVSCRPATLARDLAHFAQLGLASASVRPFDMMPHTDQVESLVWLQPAAASPPDVLFESPALIALNKAPHQQHTLVASARGSDGRFRGYRPAYELSADCSGVALLVPTCAPPAGLLRPVFSLLVRGVTHARGRVQGMRYRRERVIGGHSLLRVEAESEAKLRRGFASMGHPVLGDARADRASAKYFWLRHGLDRAFIHLAELGLEAPSDRVFRAALAPDLAAVLASLEAGNEREAPE